MKKSLVTLLIAALAVTTAALMSGCGSDTTSSDNTTPDTPPTTQESKDSDPSSQQTTVSDIISVPDSSSDTGSSDNSDNTATDLRRQIVATAEALVGIDYVSGMASPEQGFDNSGLIYYVLRENGFINCPRGTAAQKEMGTSIDFDDIREVTCSSLPTPTAKQAKRLISAVFTSATEN